MSNGEQKYMPPTTGIQARIRSLEMEREELERYVEARKGKPWSSGVVNARTRIKGIGHTIERLRSQAAAQGQATNEDSRVVRIGGREFMAPAGSTPAPATNARNTAPRARKREPWRSPPVRVENVAGGQRIERFVEVLAASATNGGGEPQYMPLP